MSSDQMSRSERRSLYRFMTIYALSTLLLFGIGAVIFYQFEVYQMQENERRAIKRDSERIIPLIKEADPKKLQQIQGLEVAVYNGKKEYLFGTFEPASVQWGRNFVLRGDILRHSRVIPPPHRNHTAFMVIERQVDTSALSTLRQTILYASLLALFVVLGLGYFLGRLFIAPMRESIKKLNLFVQDTTHELNTPISTILTNIEMLEILGKCEKSGELERIEIASKTLSRIYEDLSYLKLHESYQRRVEPVDISLLLEERLTYFSSLVHAKGLRLSTEITPHIIQEIDRTDATRLYDNLLSNAIKYSNKGGEISLSLTAEGFLLGDTGRGMDAQTLAKVFERFERGDVSEGGFGIGLDIVSGIVRHYGYRIEMDSVLGEGSVVRVWFS